MSAHDGTVSEPEPGNNEDPRPPTMYDVQEQQMVDLRTFLTICLLPTTREAAGAIGLNVSLYPDLNRRLS